MLPLLLCALAVQDAPPAPPLPGNADGLPSGAVVIQWNGEGGPVSWVAPRPGGAPAPVFIPQTPDGLRLIGDRIFLRTVAPPTAAEPFAGTLKLTAPDGTVTEYRAEFTPDPPGKDEPPRFRLGVALASMEPTGDPPGLPVGKVVEGSPAAKAGIAEGDRLISAGGAPLISFQMLRVKVAAAAERGEPLRVKVVRGDGGNGDPRLLEFEVTPETIDLQAEPWKPIPRKAGPWDSSPAGAGRLDSGEPIRWSLGPATVRPAESGEIAAERAEVRIQEARAQLELAEREEARAVQLAGQKLVSDREVAHARAKAATARAAVRLAELDRRAAEERIGADRRRRIAEAAAAEAQLRAARGKLRAVEAEIVALEQAVAVLEEQVKAGERPEAGLAAVRNRLTVARTQREATRAEVAVAEAARAAVRSRAPAAEAGDPPDTGTADADELREAMRELRRRVEEQVAEIERLRDDADE